MPLQHGKHGSEIRPSLSASIALHRETAGQCETQAAALLHWDDGSSRNKTEQEM